MNELINHKSIERLKDSAPPEQKNEFVLEILELFLDAHHPMVKKLQECIDLGNIPRMRKVAHQLKGLCLQVGADLFAASCDSFEFLEPGHGRNLAADLQNLKTVMADTDRELRNLKLKFTAR